MPREPLDAINPVENPLGYPSRTRAGSIIDPIATTVAGLDPETVANNAQAKTDDIARPPGADPTIVLANLISLSAVPPSIKNVPDKMKKGTAIMTKLSKPVKSR